MSPRGILQQHTYIQTHDSSPTGQCTHDADRGHAYSASAKTCSAKTNINIPRSLMHLTIHVQNDLVVLWAQKNPKDVSVFWPYMSIYTMVPFSAEAYYSTMFNQNFWFNIKQNPPPPSFIFQCIITQNYNIVNNYAMYSIVQFILMNETDFNY